MNVAPSNNNNNNNSKTKKQEEEPVEEVPMQIKALIDDDSSSEEDDWFRGKGGGDKAYVPGIYTHTRTHIFCIKKSIKLKISSFLISISLPLPPVFARFYENPRMFLGILYT